MKGTRLEILVIGLTLLVVSLSTSGQSGTLYRCVNSQGSIFLTDNVPTDPDFKCTFSTSYKDLTPQERAKEQREMEVDRQKIRAANAKYDAEKRAEETERRAIIAKQEAERTRSEVNRKSERTQAEIRNKESELRSIVGGMSFSDSLDTLQRKALEAAAKRGELNRLQQQDPNYRPDPNADVRRQIDDANFHLRQDLEYERQMDKLMRR